jgi:hypothetical protein
VGGGRFGRPESGEGSGCSGVSSTICGSLFLTAGSYRIGPSS